MRPDIRERTTGFTLIEVLVALTIGAIVVLLAHRLFTGVIDGARRIEVARLALDREQNARRWLAEAFGSLEVGNGAEFAGHVNRLRFTAWLRTPQGWLVRQGIDLMVREHRLVSIVEATDPFVLADSVRQLEIDYLNDAGDRADDPDGMPGERASFVREWISPVSAPLAVRLRLTWLSGSADTLLLMVGPRG